MLALLIRKVPLLDRPAATVLWLEICAGLVGSRLARTIPAFARKYGPASSDGAANVGGVIGKVTFSGLAPAKPIINMSANALCSKLHGKPASSQGVVLSPEEPPANVLVFVSQGLGNRSFDAPKQSAALEKKGCLYRPHVLAVIAGQKLLVRNDDPTSHNFRRMPMNNPEWNRFHVPGVSRIETTFAREEVAIPVKCNIHPWMKGYIAVFIHPYFAVSAQDGAFVLKDLPPGDYTITARHEKVGTLAQRVAVTPNRATELTFVFDARPAH